MYCEKCFRIIDQERCPYCKSRKVREPEPQDLCLLAELDYLPSGILEDVLQQSGIPFLKKGVMGAGMAIKVGPMFERNRFYVTFDILENAKAVYEDVFSVPENEA